MEVTLEQVKGMEEEERARRLAEQNAEEELERERSKTDLAYVVIKEEEERARRIAEDAWLDEVEEERRKTDRAHAVVASEEEKQRIVAQDQYLESLEVEQSIMDRMVTRLMEEKERDRRIHKELVREVKEREQREDAKADTIIKEEQERARRVSLDKYLDEVERERSELSRAFTRIEEEDERWRKMAEQEYQRSLPGAPKVRMVPAFVPEILEKVPKVEPEGTAPTGEKAQMLRPAFKVVPEGQTAPKTAPEGTPTVPTGERAAELRPPVGAAPPRPSASVETGKEPQMTGTHWTTRVVTEEGARKPLIVVFGGTGMQGKSVLKSLLLDGRWSLRTLARTPSSKEAVKLSQKGVEVFAGNMQNDDDLRRVLSGAYGVFAVTNYWDPQTMGRETELGCRMARIARESGVRHYIWSTLPNVERITNGRFLVPHFTGKAKVNPYIKGLGFESYTFLRPAFYYQNFATALPPKKDESGKLVWTIPMPETACLTAFDVRDIGPVAKAAFNNPVTFHRSKINLAGDHMHPQDYIIQFSYVTRSPAKVELIPPSEFAQMKVPFAKEMAEMFAYFSEYDFFGGRDWTTGKKVYPQTKSWKDYLSHYVHLEQSL